MTTEVRVTSAPNLSVANEVMNFSRLHLPEGIALAGASWSISLIRSSPYEALLSVFRFVYNLIAIKFPGYNVWLLVGDSAWQPDTRIIRYHKLWGGLKARGVVISHASCSQEVMIESGGKLKFFGATQLSELSIGSAVKALLDERCTYLVALPSTLGPQNILENGWSGDLAEDFSVIVYLSKTGGLLIQKIGEFDDGERGMVAIGQPELVKVLLS